MSRRQWIPVHAVVGRNQFKFQLTLRIGNGIADSNAVRGVPERHAIKKTFGIGIGELERPMLAGVGGFVDAGSIARPGSEEVGDLGAEA